MNPDQSNYVCICSHLSCSEVMWEYIACTGFNSFLCILSNSSVMSPSVSSLMDVEETVRTQAFLVLVVLCNKNNRYNREK